MERVKSGIDQSTPLDRAAAPPRRATPLGRLAVVLPAYNEEGAIRQTIGDMMAKLPEFAGDFVVIPVDDGSRDQTPQILDELALQNGSQLLVVHNPINRGYGGALLAGFERALAENADAIFFMDSDGQFDIAELAKFLPLLRQYDAVFGYRLDRRDPMQRKLNAWAWKQLVSALFGFHIRDIDCAFKLIRADFIRLAGLHAQGAMINTELLARFTRAKLQCVEIGVHHYPRTSGKPTGSKLTVIVRAFHELLLLRNRIAQDPPVVLESRYVQMDRSPQIASARMTQHAQKVGDMRAQTSPSSFPMPYDDAIAPATSSRDRQLHLAAWLWGFLKQYAVVALIFVVAVALRWHHLTTQSLWLDEIGEGTTAQLGFAHMFIAIREDVGAAPLDYFGVKLAITLLGHGTAATRAWAFALGCLSVLMMFFVGRAIFRSTTAGLFASLMLAFSSYDIYYSQEARFYSLSVFAVLVNLYCFHRALERRTWQSWALYALAVALCFYSAYFLLILPAVEGVYLAGVCLARSITAGWNRSVLIAAVRQLALGIAAMAMGAVLFVPWLLFGAISQTRNNGFAPPPPLSYHAILEALYALLGLALAGSSTPTQYANGEALAWLGLALVAVGLVLATAIRRHFALAIAGMLVLAVPLAWTLDQRVYYFFSPRQVIMMLPLLYLLAAAGVDYLLQGISVWLRGTSGGDDAVPNAAESATGTVSAFTSGLKSDAKRQRVIFVALGGAFALAWVAINWSPIQTVYSNNVYPKEDWRGATAFVSTHVCSDSHIYTPLWDHYSYGIAYYDPALAQQAVYDPSLRGLDPLPSLKATHFQPHDLIVLENQSQAVQAYMTTQGWSSYDVFPIHVYYRQTGCGG